MNNNSSFFNTIASVPNAAPVDKDPVSPINISAGEVLNQRNPRHAPTMALEKTLNSPAPGRYSIFK